MTTQVEKRMTCEFAATTLSGKRFKETETANLQMTTAGMRTTLNTTQGGVSVTNSSQFQP